MLAAMLPSTTVGTLLGLTLVSSLLLFIFYGICGGKNKKNTTLDVSPPLPPAGGGELDVRMPSGVPSLAGLTSPDGVVNNREAPETMKNKGDKFNPSSANFSNIQDFRGDAIQMSTKIQDDAARNPTSMVIKPSAGVPIKPKNESDFSSDEYDESSSGSEEEEASEGAFEGTGNKPTLPPAPMPSKAPMAADLRATEILAPTPPKKMTVDGRTEEMSMNMKNRNPDLEMDLEMGVSKFTQKSGQFKSAEAEPVDPKKLMESVHITHDRPLNENPVSTSITKSRRVKVKKKGDKVRRKKKVKRESANIKKPGEDGKEIGKSVRKRKRKNPSVAIPVEGV